jgi:hypothetical protein
MARHVFLCESRRLVLDSMEFAIPCVGPFAELATRAHRFYQGSGKLHGIDAKRAPVGDVALPADPQRFRVGQAVIGSRWIIQVDGATGGGDLGRLYVAARCVATPTDVELADSSAWPASTRAVVLKPKAKELPNGGRFAVAELGQAWVRPSDGDPRPVPDLVETVSTLGQFAHGAAPRLAMEIERERWQLVEFGR